MKRILIILVLFFYASTPLLLSQDVQSLQKQQRQLEQQIATTNKMLEQTKSNKKVTLNKLELLNQNIAAQRKLVQSINNEIIALNKEMSQLQSNKSKLQSELIVLQEDYAELVRQTHYAQMHQSPFIFLFSSSTFQQLVRRLRYMQEFGHYRQTQIARITNKQEAIEHQNELLAANKKAKQKTLKAQQLEQDKLARSERQQKAMLEELKKQEKTLKAQLNKQQKAVADLNAKIDNLIRQQTQTKTSLTPEQQLIAGGFEKNKGRLPWPIESGNISGHFGKHAHPVYKEVIIDNKGIYLQTTSGASARAVFEGTVSSCFVMNNTYAVIIQHGNYRTVYSGLSKLQIKQGQHVDTKQAIGTIYTNPEEDNKTELYFQIYQDRNILNPEQWILKK